MKPKGIIYEFKAKPWQYAGKGGWYFISFPSDLAQEIRENLKWQEQGWGRMKATAKIGNSEWETAIWFDTKLNTYLLPIKAQIRIKEHIVTDQEIDTTVWV